MRGRGSGIRERERGGREREKGERREREGREGGKEGGREGRRKWGQRRDLSSPAMPLMMRLSLVRVPVLSKQHTSTFPPNGIRNGSVQ